MKKKLACLFLVSCVFLSLLPTSALATDDGGLEENTHFISSLAELEAFRDYINSGNTGTGEYFELTADIDMSAKYSETTGVSWEMIGDISDFATELETIHVFQGTFDGGGHTISGLYINKTGDGGMYGFDFGALFGTVDGGTIQNLNVQGSVSVAASSGETAGIAVAVRNGAITNCSFDGVVECPNYVACGITAEGSGSVISGCKTSGKIVGQHLVAGIVGTCDSEDGCIITNCINESEITGTAIAGGIAGWGQGTIASCVNRGSVTGKPVVLWYEGEEDRITSFEIGGIAGMSNNTTIIENCCNLGTISGNTHVGGIVGNCGYFIDEDNVEYLTSMKNCFNVGAVTSTLETDGEHYIGSIIGTVTGDIWSDEGLLPGLADVSNCYYLAGTAEKGIAVCNDGTDTTTVKTAEEFAAGEVAYLLQEGNGGNTSAIIWGQNLAADKAPVLTDNTEKTVYKVAFVADETEYAMKYANPSGPTSLPDAPIKSGYVFNGWYREADCTNVWDLDTDTVTTDMTLYAKWTKTSTGSDHPAPTPIPVPIPTPEPSEPDKPVITVEQFIDVKPGAWYYDAVKYAVDNGLFCGTAEQTFAPHGPLTRGMLVTVLYRLEKEPEPVNSNLFRDVAANAWYADAVTWAAAKGVVEGYGNGIFGPDDSITREQLAAMLYRHALAKERDISVGEDTNILGYKDFDRISEWAIPAIQWAVGSGVVTGKGGGILDPNGQATRAEAAAMLQRYMMLEG